MTTDAHTLPQSPADAPAAAQTPASPTRPLYWSIRRELWENHALVIAPVIVAGLVLLGFGISMFNLSRGLHLISRLDEQKQAQLAAIPYGLAAFAVLLTGFVVAVFYCLGALHNERRDRSILFWKSLPVSDLTIVLSKVAIPMLVLPAILFVVIVATQALMLPLNAAGLIANGLSAASLWPQVLWLHVVITLIYMLVVLALWHAPIYGWLFLVSGWARRAPFLWAVLPPIAISVVEKFAFNTNHFGALVGYRLTGGFSEAMVQNPASGQVTDPLAQIDPVHFLMTPGLWAGLAFAAVFVGAAVWLRRYREPI